MKVQRDENGLFVRNAIGSVYRPGDVPGFSHVYQMDDGGLEEGMQVKVRQIAQSPIVKIVLPSGETRIWCAEDFATLRKPAPDDEGPQP